MNRKGFTYIELLASLVIIMLVITLINDDYIQGVKYYLTIGKLYEMRQYLRYSTNAICNEIRYACEVNIADSGLTNPIIDETNFTFDDNALLEIVLPNEEIYSYRITNEQELIKNGKFLGGPIDTVSIRRVEYSYFGSLYEVVVKTASLEFENIPPLKLRQLVFAPNVKP